MKHHQTVVTEVIKIKDITCDCCGCVSNDTEHPEINAGVEITMTAGYGSKFDTLGAQSWDFCDDCWEQIKSKFKARPEGEIHYAMEWS